MHKNVNLELIKEIKAGNNVSSNLSKLYYRNKGFITDVVNKFSINSTEDYQQLAFIALMQATDKFDVSYTYSFLSYYKLWLKYYFCQYKMEMQYPFRIPYKEFRKVIKETRETGVDKYKCIRVDYCDTMEARKTIPLDFEEFSIVETNLYKKEIWRVVYETLSPDNFVCVYYHFVCEMSFASIGRKIGQRRDTVRQRVVRSLAKLRKNEYLRIMAMDLYGIKP